MAVTRYDLVYRDGAATGATVANYYITDTQPELAGIGGKSGDLGLIKADNLLRRWLPGSGWIPIDNDTIFNGGTITNPLAINADPWPQLAIKVSYSQSQIRLWGDSRLFLTNNLLYTNAWVKDKADQTGQMFALDNNAFLFQLMYAGQSTLLTLAKIDGIGAIFERQRSVAMGDWTTVPFNSANFYTNVAGSSITVDTASTIKYTMIGSTMIISARIYNAPVVCNPNTLTFICIKIPNGIISQSDYMATATVYNPGVGWISGSVAVTQGNNFLQVGGGWPGFVYITQGNFYAIFQIAIQI